MTDLPPIRIACPSQRRVLVMGLPGAGKTTLAVKLAARLNSVHSNADDCFLAVISLFTMGIAP